MRVRLLQLRMCAMTVFLLAVFPLAADADEDLRKAVDKRDAKAMAAAVANGANVLQKDKYGYTPVSNMASICELEFVKILLSKFRGPTAEERELLSRALHSLAKGREGIGLDVNCGAQDEEIAQIFKLLIKAGADVNSMRDGKTSLHRMAGLDKRASVKMLLDLGADLELPDRRGMTALHISQFVGDPRTEALLKSRGAKDTEMPAGFTRKTPKDAVALRQAAEDAQKAKDQQYKDREKNKDLNNLTVRINKLQAELDNVERQIVALGGQASQVTTYGRTVTGVKCDRQNQNCRNTYQGGGETVGSQYNRINSREQIQKLDFKRTDLRSEISRLERERDRISGVEPNQTRQGKPKR